MLALKRLPDALADGDRILAVIRALCQPDSPHRQYRDTITVAQVAACREALDVWPVWTRLRWAWSGAAGAVGDPIEYASLAEVCDATAPARWHR